MTWTTERIYVPADATGVLVPPVGGTASAYAQLAPAPALRDLVDCVHLGVEHIAAGRVVEERVLADGAVHLILNLGDPVAGSDGVARDAEAQGAALAPSIVRMAGHMEAVGVRLRPGGALPLLGVPADELTGRNVSLDLLWGGAAAEARERLAAAPSGPARAEVMNRILLERLAGRDAGANAAVAAATRLIAREGGRRPVREVAAAVGVGERRLEQLFRRHVGLTPKGASRLARFRTTVARLRQHPDTSWTALAFDGGYADQSHLVHEFRELAGLTPGAFRDGALFGFFQDAVAASR